MNILHKLSGWVEKEFDDCKEGLPFFRIVFALYALIGVQDSGWISTLPDSFFFPPLGVPMLFTGYPDPAVLYVMDAVRIISLVCLLFGFLTFPASIAVGLIHLLIAGFAFSVGKIDHTILRMLIPWVGAFAGWGHRWSVDSLSRGRGGPGRSASWPVCIFAVVISFTMLTAALPKIESGWLSFETQSVLGHMIYYYHVVGTQTWLSDLLFAIKVRAFWESMDWATVLFESGFILFVWSLRSFRFFCLLAVFFHLGVYYSMDIFFGANLMAYAMFVPWMKVIPEPAAVRLARFGAAWQKKVSVRNWALLVTALGIAMTWCVMEYGNPFQSLIKLCGLSPGTVSRYLVIVPAVGIVIWSVWRAIVGPPRESKNPGEAPIVLFDGVCGLCNRWVDWILRIDRRGKIKFASLQSATGSKLLRQYGLSERYLNSIILVNDGRALTRSDAVLGVMQLTGTAWSAMNLFSVLPRFLRDAAYRIIAANRYRLFGRRDTCRLPTPKERDRFLDL